MAALKDLEQLHEATGVRVAIVYIAEAHARDQWHIGDTNHDTEPVHVHTTLYARYQAARQMRAFTYLPVYVDPLSDENAQWFGVAFERLYVVHNGQVKYQGRNGPHGFSVSAVRVYLADMYSL